MKAPVLHEPELEFRAGNRHIDPRYGISVFGPADADSPTGPRQIPIALVGPARAVDGIRSWLRRCQDHIEAKETKPGQENLHQPFPGFSSDSPFGAELVFDDALVREIPERQLRRLARADTVSATADAVEIYADAARSLAETGRCRVIICARPEELQDREDHPPSEEAAPDHEEGQDEREAGADFHDQLKATALTLSAPPCS
ncbi:argonaute/piwi family protein [Streptomyces blattellae]|uniref:hypothetical protein n=1 Tax=Streptomyces blattellae TaxID=2569855 RepID=UPI0012BA1B32|nr:hypothetical protein [Streptomyces blattellae]